MFKENTKMPHSESNEVMFCIVIISLDFILSKLIFIMFEIPVICPSLVSQTQNVALRSNVLCFYHNYQLNIKLIKSCHMVS